MSNKKGVFTKITHSVLSVLILTAMLLCAFPVASSAEDAAQEGVVSVVVMARDVKEGAKITKDDVTVKEIKNANVPSNIISDTSKVIGKYADVQLYEGEYIYSDKLLAKKPTTSTGLANASDIGYSKAKYVNMRDYIPKGTKRDVADIIQAVIDENPNRTIYFPDGVYYVSKPIHTSAKPSDSVTLMLSDGAVIKAMDSWKPITLKSGYGNNLVPEEVDVDAVIALGASDYYNDNVSIGSYYYLIGGTIDCSGTSATGVSIDSGRETLVKNVVVRNANIGVHIKRGGNGQSSDADVDDVTCIGTGKAGTTGVIVLGYDNTVTNTKTYNYEVGLEIIGGGTLVRNFEAYFEFSNYTSGINVANTVGVIESQKNGDNWLYDCYAENYTTAFKINGGTKVFDRCHAKWTTGNCVNQTFVEVKHGSLNFIIGNCKAEFYNASSYNTFYKGSSGKGGIVAAMVNTSLHDGSIPNCITPVIPIY